MNKPKAEIMNKVYKPLLKWSQEGEESTTPKVRNTGHVVCSSKYQSRGNLENKHKKLFFSALCKIFENLDEMDNFLE